MERVRNEFDFKALISDRYPFKEIDKAFDKAANDKKNAFKVMLEF
jgi:threonine dehydrogenase-like Zn-dependent dehydrogenase